MGVVGFFLLGFFLLALGFINLSNYLNGFLLSLQPVSVEKP